MFSKKKKNADPLSGGQASGLDPDIAELLGESASQLNAPPPPPPKPQTIQRPPQQSQNPPADKQGLDPEIGNLLGLSSKPQTPPPASMPDAELEEASAATFGSAQPAAPQQPIEDFRFPGSASRPQYKETVAFEIKGFIRRAVDGADTAVVQQLAKLKKLFDNPPDKKDKFLYREKLSVAFWNLLSGIVFEVGGNLTIEKRLMIRLGLLDTSYLKPEQISLVKKIPLKSPISQPLFFQDEWLRHIAEGSIKQSLVDETKKKKTPHAADQEKIERKQGSKEAELSNLRNKLDQMTIIEEGLVGAVNLIANRSEHPAYPGIKYGYEPQQKNILVDISQSCKKLSLVNREIEAQFRVLGRLEEEIAKLEGTAVTEENTIIEVDNEAITDEFNSLRQMQKMCVGRQGNHFPVLYSPYFTSDITQICTKENIMREIEIIEKLDSEIFVRVYKRESHRIFPYIIILPGYGDNGICWEPFNKYNKATSRGRLAICMFPKDLRYSLLTALADLRWQVAKEKAQHYWMEEGLTGKYYEYYINNKLKGDIKAHFINDYILWITMESQGMQKLHREVRPVFWRYTPFPKSLKDVLRNRGFFYNELFKKDENISRSDGY